MTEREYIFPIKDSLKRPMGRWANVVYWLLLIAGCAVFFLMNVYTTLKEDDFFHSVIQGTGEPIASLADVVRAWFAYMCFDTRTSNLADFLFNGLLGKTAFNICNTLVFGVMAHLLSRLTTGRNSVMVLTWLYAFIVTVMPFPGETLLWVAGSCNYLWAMMASLLFVAYLMWHRNPHPAWWQGALVVLLSFMAGGSNEGTTFGIFGGLVLYYFFNRDKVDRVVVLSMTGYLLGVILLLSCPGAWQRASLEVSHDAGFVQLLTERASVVARLSLRYVVPIAAFVILLFSLFRWGFKKTFNSTPWPWVFLVSFAFVFVLGKPQERLYFPMAFFAFMIVVLAVHALLRKWLWARVAIIVLGLALCCYKYPSHISTLQRYRSFMAQLDREIAETPGSQVILGQRYFNGDTRFIKCLNLDSWFFYIRGESLCRHYGKGNIQFVDDSICARYHEGRLLDGAQEMPFAASMPGKVESVMAFPDQDYMAVKMSQDTLSYTYQYAQVTLDDGTLALPAFYVPILYQGREYFFFKLPDNKVAKLTFAPFEFDGETIDLIRTAPNPVWANRE